ncbi:hypothetical protein [Lactiplantibacillus paraxiangfangensis]
MAKQRKHAKKSAIQKKRRRMRLHAAQHSVERPRAKHESKVGASNEADY